MGRICDRLVPDAFCGVGTYSEAYISSWGIPDTFGAGSGHEARSWQSLSECFNHFLHRTAAGISSSAASSVRVTAATVNPFASAYRRASFNRRDTGTDDGIGVNWNLNRSGTASTVVLLVWSTITLSFT
jgi:hypothetical protein